MLLEYNMELELVEGESGRKFFGGINPNQYTERFILQKGGASGML